MLHKNTELVRAQSAMEYLMTYGWAILVIAIVLAALFELGIFNSVNTTVCLSKPGFTCATPRYNATEVAFTIGQDTGHTYYNAHVFVASESEPLDSSGIPSNFSAAQQLGTGTLESGQTVTVVVPYTEYPSSQIQQNPVSGTQFNGFVWIGYCKTPGCTSPTAVEKVATIEVGATTYNGATYISGVTTTISGGSSSSSTTATSTTSVSSTSTTVTTTTSSTSSTSTSTTTSITQLSPPSITSPSGQTTVDEEQGVSVAASAATGGVSPYTYTWSVDVGTSCPGFTSPGSVLSFTYIANGTTSSCKFQISVEDNESSNAISNPSPSITVNGPPPFPSSISAILGNVNDFNCPDSEGYYNVSSVQAVTHGYVYSIAYAFGLTSGCGIIYTSGPADGAGQYYGGFDYYIPASSSNTVDVNWAVSNNTATANDINSTIANYLNRTDISVGVLDYIYLLQHSVILAQWTNSYIKSTPRVPATTYYKATIYASPASEGTVVDDPAGDDGTVWTTFPAGGYKIPLSSSPYYGEVDAATGSGPYVGDHFSTWTCTDSSGWCYSGSGTTIDGDSNAFYLNWTAITSNITETAHFT